MNRNHLAVFHAVAEAGGFSRGAEVLMVSQPAVSTQIAELESSLSLKLFDRMPRGVRLTQAGHLLADYARRMNRLEADASQALDELKHLNRGRLSIGASTTIGIYMLPNLLGNFHRKHLDVTLDFQIENTNRVEQLLNDGAFEIGFNEGFAEDPDLFAEVFHKDQLVPIAPAKHALATQKNLTAAQVLAHPIVMREPGSGTREVIERGLIMQGLNLQPALTMTSTEAIKRSVLAGLGLAIVSRLAIEDDLRQRRLVVLNVPKLTFHRPLHYLYRKGHQLSPAATAFISLMKSVSGNVLAKSPAPR